MKNSTLLNLPGATLPTIMLLAALFASHTQAQFITSDPNLPPQGVYMTPAQVHATYNSPTLTAILRQITHSDFSQIVRQTAGSDERESFFSNLAGVADVTLTPGGSFPNVPVSASGPVETIVFGKAGQITGTFQTEMLSMTLSGNSPLGPFIDSGKPDPCVPRHNEHQ